MTVSVLPRGRDPHRRDQAERANPADPWTATVTGRTVRAGGGLDGRTIALLLGAAQALFAEGADHVTLDLTAVTRIDSDAVRALFVAQLDAAPTVVLHLIVADRLRPRLAVCRLDEPLLVDDERRSALAEAS